MSDKVYCPTCGSLCEITGRVTHYYRPVHTPEVEALIAAAYAVIPFLQMELFSHDPLLVGLGAALAAVEEKQDAS